MGWLEDLAKESSHQSLGKLARAAVESTDWPAEEARNARSVENQLRALDQKLRRGQVWLTNRPKVREILADLLNMSPEGLDPGGLDDEVPAEPRFYFHDLPDARPIDLRTEPLFAGIPREVLEPEKWGLTWWFAQSGAGRTVVGQWLKARRKAAFLKATRWSEVAGSIPAEGCVYVELAQSEPGDALRRPADLKGRKICVAAPFFPAPIEEVLAVVGRIQKREQERREREERGDESEEEDDPEFDWDWDIVKTPHAEEWAEALIRWIGERIPPGGGFDADEAVGFLSSGTWPQLLHTPGDYFGLCGLMERYGAKRFLEMSTDRIASTYLEGRAERPDLRSGMVWGGEDLWRVVQGVTEGVIVHSPREDGFLKESSLAEWLPDDSLPPGQVLDSARILELTPEEFARYKERAIRSPRSAVQELTRLRILEPVGEGLVEMHPKWLAFFATLKAISKLIEEPGRGLGKAFLQPSRAGWLVEFLLHALGGEETAEDVDGEEDEGSEEDEDESSEDIDSEEDEEDKYIGDAIRSLDPADSASIALVEAWFMVLGLALLDPDYEVSVATLKLLWDTEMRLAVSYDAIEFAAQPRALTISDPRGRLFDPWEIACFSISERLLAAGHAVEPSPLVPWNAASEPHVGVTLIWSGCRLPLRFQDPPAKTLPQYTIPAFRLARRLYRHSEHAQRWLSPEVKALFGGIDAVKAAARVRWTSFSWWKWLDVMVPLAADDGVGEAEIFAAIWRGAKDPAKLKVEVERLDDACQERFWAALPPVLIPERFHALVGEEEGLPWERLSDAQWEGVLQTWRRHRGKRHGIEHVPREVARRVVAEELGGNEPRVVWAVLWDRFPDLCLEATVDALLLPDPVFRYGRIEWSTPEDRVEAVILALRRRAGVTLQAQATRGFVAVWAHSGVLGRGPGWKAAWELLMEVQPVGRSV